MAREVTVGALITRIRDVADLVNDGNITDAEMIRYISASYTWLYDILVSKGLHYFESTDTTVADGINTQFALPDDFYAALAVHFQYETNRWRSLPEHMLQEVAALDHRDSAEAYSYRVVGGNLELLPRPASGKTYRLLYVPAPADLDAAGDAVDGVSGWEELIVIDVAITCRIKQETQVIDLERRLARMLARVEEAAEHRSLSSTRRVTDVDSSVIEKDPGDYTHRGY